MKYFEDLNYETLAIKITDDKEDAAHFAYEDQSSVGAIDVIVGLLNLASASTWSTKQDPDDEDNRYIIFRENNS
jgi:hypothetical protein